jgi:hypothetical protein
MADLITFDMYGHAKLPPFPGYTKFALVQEILFNAARHPISEQVILESIGKGRKGIDIFKSLVDRGLLKPTPSNSYVTPVILINSKEKDKIITEAMKKAEEEARIVEKYIPHLEHMYNTLEVGKYAWKELQYQTLVLLSDVFVGYLMRKENFLENPPQETICVKGKSLNNGNYYLWGVEGGTGSKYHFGVNLWNDRSYVFGCLWSHTVETPVRLTHLDRLDRAILKTVCEAEYATQQEILEAFSSFSNLEIIRSIENLKFFGLITRDSRGLRGVTPFFPQKDVEKVEPFLEKAALDIFMNVIIPSADTIDDLFNSFGFSQEYHDKNAFICLFRRFILDLCFEIEFKQVAEAPLLNSMSPLQASWIWEGKSRIFSAFT